MKYTISRQWITIPKKKKHSLFWEIVGVNRPELYLNYIPFVVWIFLLPNREVKKWVLDLKIFNTNILNANRIVNKNYLEI